MIICRCVRTYKIRDILLNSDDSDDDDDEDASVDSDNSFRTTDGSGSSFENPFDSFLAVLQRSYTNRPSRESLRICRYNDVQDN
ncbi:hypothetical protein NQZ68_037253 [Dissostichus eleginoides]|nr:hypothetical protein NQZ68_037253 [Dissostichus eleginoides]